MTDDPERLLAAARETRSRIDTLAEDDPSRLMWEAHLKRLKRRLAERGQETPDDIFGPRVR